MLPIECDHTFCYLDDVQNLIYLIKSALYKLFSESIYNDQLLDPFDHQFAFIFQKKVTLECTKLDCWYALVILISHELVKCCNLDQTIRDLSCVGRKCNQIPWRRQNWFPLVCKLSYCCAFFIVKYQISSVEWKPFCNCCLRFVVIKSISTGSLFEIEQLPIQLYIMNYNISLVSFCNHNLIGKVPWVSWEIEETDIALYINIFNESICIVYCNSSKRDNSNHVLVWTDGNGLDILTELAHFNGSAHETKFFQ